MSMMGNGRMRGVAAEMPSGEVVATFADYVRAQKAVSTLVAAEVPARHITIVGTGLRSFERVTGKLGWGSAARTGAINGTLLGVFFAAIVAIGMPDAPLQLFAGVLLMGIAFGMLLNLLSYSFVRRRRDYVSFTQVLAEQYEVTVVAASAHKARAALGPQGAGGGGGSAVSPRATPSATRESDPRTAGGVSPAPGSTEAPTAPQPPAAEGPPQYGERLPNAATVATAPNTATVPSGTDASRAASAGPGTTV